MSVNLTVFLTAAVLLLRQERQWVIAHSDKAIGPVSIRSSSRRCRRQRAALAAIQA